MHFGSISFIFMQLPAKILPNNRLAPPPLSEAPGKGFGALPKGNSGSTRVIDQSALHGYF